MLDTDELRRRIVAARALRGVDQTALNGLFVADGLDKHEAARLERGELPWTRVRARALAYALRMPERWFTEPNIDVLLSEIASAQPPDAAPPRLPQPGGALGQHLEDHRTRREADQQTPHPEEEEKRQGDAG